MSAVIKVNFRNQDGTPKVAKLEQGYTRIANGLLEAIIVAPLTDRQRRALLAIARLTYGFGEKSARIPLKRLAEMTGLTVPHCSESVTALIELKILERDKGQRAKIGINNHVGEWALKLEAQSGEFPQTVETQPEFPQIVETDEFPQIVETEFPQTVETQFPQSVETEQQHSLYSFKETIKETSKETYIGADAPQAADAADTNASSKPPERKLSKRERWDRLTLIERAELIIGDLNKHGIKKFSAKHPNGKPTKAADLISGLLKKGYWWDDFVAVHDNRVADWGNDPVMRKFLRPVTLYGPKFEDYLGEALAVEEMQP